MSNDRVEICNYNSEERPNEIAGLQDISVLGVFDLIIELKLDTIDFK